jgi:RHS repeat-associated protein
MATLFPAQVVNALGHVTHMVTDTALGKSLVHIDPNGIVTRSAYDGFGRLVRERGPVGDTVTGYARADTDTNADPRARLRATTTVGGGRQTSEYLDALGRTIETRTNGYAGTTVITTSTLDWADRPVRISRPRLPNDTSQGATTFDYDALGRMVAERRPDDDAPNDVAVTTLRYGWPDEAPSFSTYRSRVRASAAESVAVTDPLNRTAVQVDDINESLVATVDAAGAVTQVEYAPFGAVLRIVDPRGAVTAFEPDRYNRNAAVTTGDTGRHTYTWSAFGQLLTHGNARPVTTTYTYDQLGRMKTRTDPRGTANWTYDGPGPNAKGRLVEARSADGHVTRLSYEPIPATGPNRGLLAATEQVVDGRTYRIGYGYDQFGRVSHIEYPAVGTTTFGVDHAYDTRGMLTQVRDSATGRPYWSFVDDDQGYRIGVERLGNNVTTTSTFQPLSGRPQAIRSAVAGAAAIQDLAYGYNAVGNVMHMRDVVRPDRSRHYGYDAVNRLLLTRSLVGNNPATPGPTVESYTYDRAGNMTNQSNVGTYVYGPATGARPNAVLNAGPNVFVYDAAGNQISRTGPNIASGGQSVSWTPANLPSAVVSGGTSLSSQRTEFEYAASEKRVLRRDPNAVTTYFADLYERRDPAGVEPTIEHRYYVQAGDKTVAQVVRTERNGQVATSAVTYEHPDRLGSPLDHSDQAGARGQSQRFASYGRNLEPDWPRTGERGFAGHQHDADLGLIDMDGRLYDPLVARFLSVDPTIVDPASGESPGTALVARAAAAAAPGEATAPAMSAGDLMQPYAYAANNPLSYVDPDGRSPASFYRMQETLDRTARRIRDSTLGHAVAGFSVGVTQGATPGGFAAGPVMSHYAPSRTFEFFRGAGETIYGVGQMVTGGAGMFGGGALTATGAGAPVGVPVVAGSAVLVGEGAADVGFGIGAMTHALFGMGNDRPTPGGGESTAGTPAPAPRAGPPPAGKPKPFLGPPVPSELLIKNSVVRRVNELRRAIPANSKGRITMAVGVGRDASGKLRTVVATSEKNGYLRKGVKLKPHEELAPGTGHAERDILKYMKAQGVKPEWIGATRLICSKCLRAIQRAGAQPATPLKNPRNTRW